jgi:hypothetical protein
MSKPITVVLLCEDNLTSVFLRSYLKECRVFHGIRVSSTPSGSGFDWVLRQYPIEVNAYRQSKARIRTWLIVTIDADSKTVASRINQLDSKLKRSENARLREFRVQDESIARLVPRRNIETWLLVLTRTAANEEDDYKKTKDREEWQELTKPASQQLYNWTRPNTQLPADCIESLRLAVRELNHLSELSR